VGTSDVAAAQEVAGTYLNNRREFGEVPAHFSPRLPIDATADDGFIVMEGARYAPLGNDVWVALSGFRLRVVRGEDGTIKRLHGGRGTATFERVSP
jgi:hypothetical protein